MVEERVRRRAGFQSGRWVRMGDQQPWMFPPPPSPGVDRAYDALIEARHESEDADDERRIDLALAILLLGRNYAPTPREYQEIFDFGTDESARYIAQSAISEIVYNDLEKRRAGGRPARRKPTPAIHHTHFRGVKTSVRTYAGRVYSTVAPWIKQSHGRP